MDIKNVLLREFLKRIDLKTICQDEDVLVKAFERVLGKDIDAREFVRMLKQAYFDKLYKEFVEEIKKIESLHEKPEEIIKTEIEYEGPSEIKYDILAGIVFVESAVKKPVPIDVLENVLFQLGISTENLNDVLEELERENLVEKLNSSITVTKDGKAKVQELKLSEKFREWKEIVSRDESLKQLLRSLTEQKKKVTTLSDLEE